MEAFDCIMAKFDKLQLEDNCLLLVKMLRMIPKSERDCVIETLAKLEFPFLTDYYAIIVSDDVSLESVSEEQMNAAGWFRREEGEKLDPSSQSN